jgi:hypothetical protein
MQSSQNVTLITITLAILSLAVGKILPEPVFVVTFYEGDKL